MDNASKTLFEINPKGIIKVSFKRIDEIYSEGSIKKKKKKLTESCRKTHQKNVEEVSKKMPKILPRELLSKTPRKLTKEVPDKLIEYSQANCCKNKKCLSKYRSNC